MVLIRRWMMTKVRCWDGASFRTSTLCLKLQKTSKAMPFEMVFLQESPKRKLSRPGERVYTWSHVGIMAVRQAGAHLVWKFPEIDKYIHAYAFLRAFVPSHCNHIHQGALLGLVTGHQGHTFQMPYTGQFWHQVH